MLVGFGLGWTAPIIPKLKDPEQSPVGAPITEEQASWIASVLYIGTITGRCLNYLHFCRMTSRMETFGWNQTKSSKNISSFGLMTIDMNSKQTTSDNIVLFELPMERS